MQNRNYHQYLAIILHGHTYVFSNQNEQKNWGVTVLTDKLQAF